jgi:kinesin family protein C1
MANRSDEEADFLSNKETGKGMLPSPSHLQFPNSTQGYSIIQVKKLRDSKSMHSLKSTPSIINMRDASVSTAMGMLRIDEDLPDEPQKYQAITGTAKPPSVPTLTHKLSISSGLRNLRINSTENALVLFQAPGDSLVAPKTPSQIPVLSKMEAVVATPATPSKTPKKSPQKTPFLSKNSNIPAFGTEFNIQGRLESIEAMYSDLKDKFSGTNAERNGLEDAVAIYRARGMSYFAIE